MPVASPFMSRDHTAIVAGTGLVGGSVGMALRRDGWHVTGSEPDTRRARTAIEK